MAAAMNAEIDRTISSFKLYYHFKSCYRYLKAYGENIKWTPSCSKCLKAEEKVFNNLGLLSTAHSKTRWMRKMREREEG